MAICRFGSSGRVASQQASRQMGIERLAGVSLETKKVDKTANKTGTSRERIELRVGTKEGGVCFGMGRVVCESRCKQRRDQGRRAGGGGASNKQQADLMD